MRGPWAVSAWLPWLSDPACLRLSWPTQTAAARRSEHENAPPHTPMAVQARASYRVYDGPNTARARFFLPRKADPVQPAPALAENTTVALQLNPSGFRFQHPCM